jgi:hypothetical protein
MRYNLEFSILWPSKADQFLVRENISVLNTICLRHECVLINGFRQYGACILYIRLLSFIKLTKQTTGIEILYVNIKQNPEVCRSLKKKKYNAALKQAMNI